MSYDMWKTTDQTDYPSYMLDSASEAELMAADDRRLRWDDFCAFLTEEAARLRFDWAHLGVVLGIIGLGRSEPDPDSSNDRSREFWAVVQSFIETEGAHAVWTALGRAQREHLQMLQKVDAIR